VGEITPFVARGPTWFALTHRPRVGNLGLPRVSGTSFLVLCHCSLPAERVLRPGPHVAVADTRSALAAAVAAVGCAPFVVKHSKRPPHKAKRGDDQGCEVFTVCRETLPGK